MRRCPKVSRTIRRDVPLVMDNRIKRPVDGTLNGGKLNSKLRRAKPANFLLLFSQTLLWSGVHRILLLALFCGLALRWMVKKKKKKKKKKVKKKKAEFTDFPFSAERGHHFA
jgi:hypothetical protein